MIKPFHLSFSVGDLESTKYFYHGILGCNIGRERQTWMDLDFFGHQITVHQAAENGCEIAPIDHFGVILDKFEWENLLTLLKGSKVDLFLEPSFSKLGELDEKAKFMVKDPDGNILEFKYYLDFEKTLKRI